MKFKIAVVQFAPKTHLPGKNLIRIEKFIKQAANLHADVIIFPEDFITAPIWNRPDLIDGKFYYRDKFIEFAKKYKMDIVAGSFIEHDKSGDYNTSYYVDYHGKIRGKYRKINLWLPERKYLKSGKKVSVFNTRFGKVGIVICWDLAFPEIFRKMVKSGAKIIYCPSFWGATDARVAFKNDSQAEYKLVKVLAQARAMENGIIFVYCNAAGELRVGNYYDKLIGCSQITYPIKGVIKILDHNKEEMFIQEIDTDIINAHEKAYQIKSDLKKRMAD